MKRIALLPLVIVPALLLSLTLDAQQITSDRIARASEEPIRPMPMSATRPNKGESAMGRYPPARRFMPALTAAKASSASATISSSSVRPMVMRRQSPRP